MLQERVHLFQELHRGAMRARHLMRQHLLGRVFRADCIGCIDSERQCTGVAGQLEPASACFGRQVVRMIERLVPSDLKDGRRR
jgi:hypothetical protein